MPEYWETASDAKTQLQIGTEWPDRGGPAYAGNLNDIKTWPYSPYVSHRWYTADFSENGGIYTLGLNSCSALVYLFGPQDGEPTHGALWHVNCSVYGNEHSPERALAAINVPGLTLRYVIIGFNNVTQGKEMSEETRGSIRDFRQFLSRFEADVDPWIYVGRSDMFGVSKSGFVGLPFRMAQDHVSPKRLSIAEASSGNDHTTVTCCSRCYITTAVCRGLGLGDDCGILRELRAYRDKVLAFSPGGPAEIAEYYATAPRIVAAIDAGHNAQAAYQQLYEDDLVPALAAIQRRDYVAARAIYRSMCRRLQARYL